MARHGLSKPGRDGILRRMAQHRIGVDLGGTKIEIIVLRPDGAEALRRRIPTPTG